AAAGPEAPLVTTCGTMASWFARRRRLSRNETRMLTIAGVAAAFALLVGAPVGSALVPLEVLHRGGMEGDEALVPSIVGSLSGYACYVVATQNGLTPVWHIPDVDKLHSVDLLWALGAGVVGALVAVVFTFAVLGLRRVFARISPMVRPVVGGV